MIADMVLLILGWAGGVVTALLALRALDEPPQLIDPDLLPARLDPPPPAQAKVLRLVPSPYAPKRKNKPPIQGGPWTGG